MPRIRVTAPPDPWQYALGFKTLPRAAAPATRTRGVYHPPAGPVGQAGPPGSLTGAVGPHVSNYTPPGFNYDTDPEVLAAKAAEQAGLGSIDQQLLQLKRRALIDWGDLGFARQSGIQLTDADLAAIQANMASGNSGLSRLNRQRDDSRQAVINQLAGAGIIGSGELGYQEGQVQQNYGNALYDAQQQLLGAFSQADTQALGSRQQLRDAVIQALSSAYGRYLSNPWMYTGVAAPY